MGGGPEDVFTTEGCEIGVGVSLVQGGFEGEVRKRQVGCELLGTGVQREVTEASRYRRRRGGRQWCPKPFCQGLASVARRRVRTRPHQRLRQRVYWRIELGRCLRKRKEMK